MTAQPPDNAVDLVPIDADEFIARYARDAFFVAHVRQKDDAPAPDGGARPPGHWDAVKNAVARRLSEG